MRELHNYERPQIDRNEPAIEPETIDFEVISSGRPSNWGEVVVRLGSKGIDRTADIAEVAIVHVFYFLGQLVKHVFIFLGQLVKMAWKAWTSCPAKRVDYYEQPPRTLAEEGRIIIIQHHHHYNF